MQSVAYILEDNKQSQAQPSPHFDVTLSVGCYGSQANKRRCLPQIVGRGRYSDKAGAGGTPFPLCERRGGKLQAAVSFHCIRVCRLVGAGWQAPPGGDLQCRCLLEEKKMHPEQVVVFKGTQSSKEKKKERIFVRGRAIILGEYR